MEFQLTTISVLPHAARDGEESKGSWKRTCSSFVRRVLRSKKIMRCSWKPLLAGPLQVAERIFCLPVTKNADPRWRSRPVGLGIQGKVHFLGLRADICEALAAADVFVLASHSEGNPLSLMEAMAAGLPVVATAVGGVPELIADRTSGLLVRPGDADGFVAAMLRLLQDEETRRMMAVAAARYAKEVFDASRMAQGYMHLYERLLEETRAAQDTGAEIATHHAN